MKRLFSLPLLLTLYLFQPATTTSSPLMPSNTEFEELFILYVDEEYEKCMKKSLKATQDDESRKHPLPYLYAAMAYYELHKDEALNIEHPKALRYAMKYAARFQKKDEENQYASLHSWFLPELTKEAYTAGKVQYDWKNYRKAYSQYKKIVRFAPNDLASQLMLGMSAAQARSVRDAQLAFEAADALANDYQQKDQLDEASRSTLRNALLNLYNYNEQQAAAPEAMETYANLGKKWFPKDEELLIYLEDFIAANDIE
jgi:hypothetical protein